MNKTKKGMIIGKKKIVKKSNICRKNKIYISFLPFQQFMINNESLEFQTIENIWKKINKREAIYKKKYKKFGIIFGIIWKFGIKRRKKGKMKTSRT